MTSGFIIKGLRPEKYDEILTLSSEELKQRNIHSYVVDSFPGYPCRASLEDAPLGEEVLLFTYEHHGANSPYRASGPIFIRKNATTANLGPNEIPKMLEHRLLSLRAYDINGMMLDARTSEGLELRIHIPDIFDNPQVSYIHIHNAGPGCFNCAVHRNA